MSLNVDNWLEFLKIVETNPEAFKLYPFQLDQVKRFTELAKAHKEGKRLILIETPWRRSRSILNELLIAYQKFCGVPDSLPIVAPVRRSCQMKSHCKVITAGSQTIGTPAKSVVFDEYSATFLPVIIQQDNDFDPHDVETWKKANPAWEVKST